MIATKSFPLHIPCLLLEAQEELAKHRGVSLEQSIVQSILDDLRQNLDHVPKALVKQYMDEIRKER
jgi:hypothetical protein